MEHGGDEAARPSKQDRAAARTRPGPPESVIPSVDRLTPAVWIVALTGAAERFAYWSMSAPLQNYIQNARSGSGNPGALGLGQQMATTITNCFLLLQYIAPIIFAVVSDMRLGRLKTLLFSLGIYQLGSLILLVSSLPVALDHQAGLPGLLMALVLIALGVAGVKASLPPFLVDQYSYSDEEQKILKVKGNKAMVADRTLTVEFITNLFFWLSNIATMSTVASTFVEKKVGFWVSNLMGFTSLLVAQILIWSWRYRVACPKVQSSGLPLAVKALTCAVTHRFSLTAASPQRQQQLHGRETPWSSNTISDLRKTLAVFRILLCSAPFYLAFIQINNNLISQAGQMRLQGVSNDTMQMWNPVACIILGPIVQRGMFPLLRRAGFGFRPIARIATACLVMGLGTAYAAGLQKLIYSRGPCYDRPLECSQALVETETGIVARGNEVSVWIQVPVWFILALGEILGFTTISEIAYEQAPGNMKSVTQAMTQMTAGLATILGIALSPITKNPTLVLLYSIISSLTGASAILFWVLFRQADQQQASVREEGEAEHLRVME